MRLEELRAKLRRYAETKATVWDFNGDHVHTQQASIVADALKADAAVVELKLRGELCTDNMMGPEGAEAVAAALRHNTTLHSVDLSRSPLARVTWGRKGTGGRRGGRSTPPLSV
eukprot:EG_transcript_37512